MDKAPHSLGGRVDRLRGYCSTSGTLDTLILNLVHDCIFLALLPVHDHCVYLDTAVHDHVRPSTSFRAGYQYSQCTSHVAAPCSWSFWCSRWRPSREFQPIMTAAATLMMGSVTNRSIAAQGPIVLTATTATVVVVRILLRVQMVNIAHIHQQAARK
jgi:hypothetical protein